MTSFNNIYKISHEIIQSLPDELKTSNYIFSLYYFTSDSYKDDYRLSDCVKNQKIFFINKEIDIKIDENININNYFNNSYKNSEIFKIIKDLYLFNFNDYITLFRKYVQKKEIYDFIDPKLYIDEAPVLFKNNIKKFKSLNKTNIKLYN